MISLQQICKLFQPSYRPDASVYFPKMVRTLKVIIVL